jgi:hypothetical protein
MNTLATPEIVPESTEAKTLNHHMALSFPLGQAIVLPHEVAMQVLDCLQYGESLVDTYTNPRLVSLDPHAVSVSLLSGAKYTEMKQAAASE